MVYMNNRKANEDVWRKMNDNLNENKELFQKEVNIYRGEVCVRSKSKTIKLVWENARDKG